MPRYIAGKGPLQPKLVILGEAPGKYEDEQGEPFVGPSGKMLDEFLRVAGVKRDECYITNVCKYRPPFNDLKKLYIIGVDLNEQISNLWTNEIKVLHPNCILAVGDTALQATTGLSGIINYRGSILTANDGFTKVVPTIHPAALFSHYQDKDEGMIGGLDYVWSKLIQADISRAVEESSSPTISLPSRELRVCHNSLDLFRFIREYEGLQKAASDIESINCIPVCVGFAFDRYRAISIPLLRSIGNHQLTDMSDRELNECWRLVQQLFIDKQLIGHNFKYDEFKLRLAGFNHIRLRSDTLIKLRVIFPELPEKKLSTAASLWTREPYYKDEGKEFKLGKSPISQLFKYNAKDCAVDFEVDEETDKDLDELADRYKVPLRDYYYNYMMRKHHFYLNMENNGFKIDHKKKAELSSRYLHLQQESHQRLIELIGHEVNVKSYPQMYQLLYKEMGFRPYKNNPTSEDSIVKLLGTHCKGKKAEYAVTLEEILEERRIRDQRSRNINFTEDYDGRCKTSFNIAATETCRSSTGVLKKPIRPKKIGLAFHTISKHGRLAKDIRSMFIPDSGKVFIQADASQCQARIVAVLAEDWELLNAFDTVDIHRRTAGLIFGYSSNLILTAGTIPKIDELEKDGPERFTGKMVRHAVNFDMGKRRFMQEFNTACQKSEIKMSISEWKAGQMIETLHTAQPKLRGKFHADIKAAINSSRTLIDPYGGVRVFNGRLDDSNELYKEAYANLPQRTEAHLIQSAALAVSDEIGHNNRDVKFISENHDSLLMQVPANDWMPYAKLLKLHMEKPINFRTYCTLKRDYDLVIPCDIEISETNWSEMRKVKL